MNVVPWYIQVQFIVCIFRFVSIQIPYTIISRILTMLLTFSASYSFEASIRLLYCNQMGTPRARSNALFRYLCIVRCIGDHISLVYVQVIAVAGVVLMVNHTICLRYYCYVGIDVYSAIECAIGIRLQNKFCFGCAVCCIVFIRTFI